MRDRAEPRESGNVSRPGSCFFEKRDKVLFHGRKGRFLLFAPDLHQTNRLLAKLPLMLPENLPDAAFPNISPNRCGLHFPAHHDPDHGLFPRGCLSFVVPLAHP